MILISFPLKCDERKGNMYVKKNSILTVPHNIDLFASLWIGTVDQEKKCLFANAINHQRNENNLPFYSVLFLTFVIRFGRVKTGYSFRYNYTEILFMISE